MAISQQLLDEISISIAEMKERVGAGMLFEPQLLDRISHREILISSWPRRVFQKLRMHNLYYKGIPFIKMCMKNHFYVSMQDMLR